MCGRFGLHNLVEMVRKPNVFVEVLVSPILMEGLCYPWGVRFLGSSVDCEAEMGSYQTGREVVLCEIVV